MDILNHFAPLYSLEAGYRLYEIMTDRTSFRRVTARAIHGQAGAGGGL